MIIYIKEWQHYSEAKLRKLLNLEQADYLKFMQIMRERRILEENDDLTYSFKYVGLIEY